MMCGAVDCQCKEHYLSQKSPHIVLMVSIQEEHRPHRTLLLYDGECRFCRRSALMMAHGAGERVRILPAQSGAGTSYGICADRRPNEVTLIENNGKILHGAAAIFRLMNLQGSRAGELLWWFYRKVGIFRAFAEWGYRIIARMRHIIP